MVGSQDAVAFLLPPGPCGQGACGLHMTHSCLASSLAAVSPCQGGRQRPCPCSQLGHWRAGGLRGPSSCITGCHRGGLETMGFLLSHFPRREGWDAGVGSPRAL